MNLVVLKRLLLAAALPFAIAFAAPVAMADDREWHSSFSLIGKTKYEGREFTHYDHVNRDAPKGGTLNQATRGTFDSFNPFIVKGTPAGGLNYQGGLLWDNLMSKAVDESSASHPLIATDFSYPDDYSSATYRLNPEARWHDGVPITADDVVWTLEQMQTHSPQYSKYFGDVTGAVADNNHQVTFTFGQKGNRELPFILSDLPVLPKHWWTEQGKDRDFTRSSLEPPLGSGPYRIADFDAGRSITWERVEDYWAADLPVNKGRYNFDRRVIRYFNDPNAIWEAFKKGGFQDLREENRAQRWAKSYNFPAFRKGLVVKEAFEEDSSYTMQGWVLNARLEKFSDPRVRRALALAFNFERMNETIFFNQYTRTKTYFGGTELSATGLPEGQELAILEDYRDRLPAELFTQGYDLPIYESTRDERKHLRAAFNLLQEAGYVREGTALIDPATGEQMTLEILGSNPDSEKINLPWLNSLRKLGINATFRIVDTAQFIARVGSFDYEVVSVPTRQSQSPGNEQREYWSSQAAETPGSRNYAGINDPVVDELIERLILAKDRQELIALTRALDRVLLWGHYVVPQWHLSSARIARWDKFDFKRPQPGFIGIDLDSWWIDPAKEAALEAAR